MKYVKKKKKLRLDPRRPPLPLTLLRGVFHIRITGVGSGKFTLRSVISIFDVEDVNFLPPFFLTFNFYLFYAFCEDFKSISCLEKKLWIFCRT